MHLFELYLIPLDGKQFQSIVKSSSESDGNCVSCLPFWDGDRDWYSSIVKTLESASFPQNPGEVFKKPGEQDWMVSAKILSQRRSGFHPNYLEHIGQALYESLFPSGEVRDAFKLALRRAEEAEELLHLRLKFPEKKRSQLADYPWELIHDGRRFLQHRALHISRYIAYEGLPPRFPRQEKLRVLLVSSRPTDLAQLPDLEQQALREGIARAEGIELHQLAVPTIKGLRQYLTQQVPQVLHFDGHGLYGKRCGSCGYVNPGVMAESCKCGQDLPEAQGFLVFQDDRGRADYVSAASMAASLPKGIGLVVLSACQSGMAMAGESVFNGTAQQLIDGRVPAVVGMQYKVRVKEAGAFVEGFYRVLGAGRSLLEATNAGRVEMGTDGNQWYRPVVYLRWRDNHGGQLFEEANVVLKQQVTVSEQQVTVSELTAEQRKQWRNALISAFPRQQDIELMLEDEMDIQLNSITQGQSNYELVIRDLIKAAESQGWLARLLVSALQSNPGNSKLQELKKVWLIM